MQGKLGRKQKWNRGRLWNVQELPRRQDYSSKIEEEVRNEGQQLLLVLRHNKGPVESLASGHQVEQLAKESRMGHNNADRILHKKSFKVWGVVEEQWEVVRVRHLPDLGLLNNSRLSHLDLFLGHHDQDLLKLKLKVVRR